MAENKVTVESADEPCKTVESADEPCKTVESADEPCKTTGLTVKHKDAIRASFQLVRPDLKTHGVMLLIEMFRSYPELQGRFSGFKDKTFEELKVSKRFAAHGNSVMLAVSGFVENLDDLECLVEMLKSLALRHKKRGIFKEDYEKLSLTILKYLKENLGDAYTKLAEEGWTMTLKVINSVIFQAYDGPEEQD